MHARMHLEKLIQSKKCKVGQVLNIIDTHWLIFIINQEVEETPPPEEEPRYRLVPLPDLTSKYCQEMESKEAAKVQGEIDKVENERLAKIAVSCCSMWSSFSQYLQPTLAFFFWSIANLITYMWHVY